MEPPELQTMSKTDKLRGIISERLTAAAWEILAEVQRTVADYEEEAAGFKEEIERQRRQLELLQRPTVKEEPTDDQELYSLCEAGGREIPVKEEQHTYEIDDLYSLREAEGREIPVKEEQHTYEIAPTAPTDTEDVSRPPVRDLEDIVNLRICILRDWNIKVLSRKVFKKYPFHELECPGGLQEVQFLNLLRSTLPPLAFDKPFEFFITDRTKRLIPLRVESFTPEQVSEAAGNSALYIRLKRPVDFQAGQDGGENSPKVQAGPNTRRESSRQKRPRDRTSPKDSHLSLKVCVLEDSDVVSPQACQMATVHELQCPCGLQEADFVNLLKSTFPALATERPIEPFVTNRTKKLHPLVVESFTPEQVCRAAGASALYLRLKRPAELQTGQEGPPLDDEGDDYDDDYDDSSRSTPRLTAANTETEARGHEGGPHRVREDDAHIKINVSFLGHPQADVIPPHVLRKCPPRELKCPRGLTEADFLNVLKSTFPGLAGGQAFTILADQGGQISPLKVDSVTPEALSRTRGSTGSPVIYVQLKEKRPLTEDLRPSPSPASPLTRVQPVRPQSTELPGDYKVELKICILDDPTIEEITPLVFQKYSIHDVQFPMHLQENQFLDSVKSVFPSLAGKAFEFLICHGNKLKPLEVQNPTPQKIRFIIRSFTGTVLYIRLKGQENVQDHAATARSDVPDQTKSPTTSESRQRTKRKTNVLSRNSKSLRRDEETDDSLDSDPDASPPTLQPQLPDPSSQTTKEQSVQRPDVRPNSQLDEDETEDSEDSEYDKPEPSRLWSMPHLLPEPTTQLESCSPEPKKSTEEQHDQPSEVVTDRCLDDEETEDSEDCDDDSNAVSSDHRDKKSRNPEPTKTTTERIVKPSTERPAESKDMMDAGGGSRPILLTLLQTSDTGSDQNRNPDPVEVEQSAASSSFPSENKAPQNHEASGGLKESAGVLSLQYSRNPEPLKLKEPIQPSLLPKSQTSESTPTITSMPLVPCKVCSSLRGSENMLIKHAWTHVNEGGMVCGVCGERSESTDELRRHLQAHQKTHNCTICGKSFLTLCGFRGHMNRHEGKRPYKCVTCHKAFAGKSVLNKHVQSHKEQYKCTICPRAFSSEIRLKLHLLTHRNRKQDGASPQTSAALGPAHTPAKEKRFGCEVCHKSFFTKKAFQRHAARHATKTPTA